MQDSAITIALSASIGRVTARALESPREELAEDIIPYKPPAAQKGLNEFLLIVKPEMATPLNSVAVSDVLVHIIDHLEQSGVHVSAIRALSGAHVKRHNLFSEQYPVLAAVATCGLSGCHEIVRTRIVRLAERENLKVVSAVQFLSMHHQLNAWSLSLICDNVGSVKIGAGVYASRITQGGVRYLVLNAFQPEQAAWLSRFGSSCVALQCTTMKLWSEIRAAIVGGIDPAKAPLGSLRRLLYDYCEEHSLERLTVAHNGVHVSPGPIEAAFQLSAYFQVPVARTNLGRELKRSSSALTKLRKNPGVAVCGSCYPLTEAQEDMDTDTAVELIRSLSL